MPKSTSAHDVVGGELSFIDAEALGRRRPAAFSTIWYEMGFAISLLGSMAMSEFFISGFHIVLPLLTVELDMSPAAQTWPSSVFTLTAATFLLPLGRLTDMYGAYVVFNSGLVWVYIWCLASGFSQSYITLIVCRAMTGVGAAAFLRAGITLIGKIYRPGPRKNLIFAVYGAFAPLGFFLGVLVGGVTGQVLSWRCQHRLDSASTRAPDGLAMDWLGAVTIALGLILLVYGITDSSQAPQGWASPQIIAAVVTSACFLAVAVYIEGWVATNPLVPSDFFSPPYMKRLVVALFFAYGAFGIFLFYSSFYLELVLKKSPLQTAVWYIPMIISGLVLAAVGGMTLHLLPGCTLLLLSGTGFVVACLLFSLMPAGPNYWAWIMPAMIASSIGIDITFTVSNVFITTNLPCKRQGLAGALINSTLFLGISVFLGLANVAVANISDLPLRKNYQVAFWLGVGVSGVAMLVFAFIDLGQAKSELTVEERERMEQEAHQDA